MNAYNEHRYLLRVRRASDNIVSVVVEASHVVRVTAHGGQFEVTCTTFLPATLNLASVFVRSFPSFAFGVLLTTVSSHFWSDLSRSYHDNERECLQADVSPEPAVISDSSNLATNLRMLLSY